MSGKIILITGQPGTGKTTLAKNIVNSMDNYINIDGDELRAISDNNIYTRFGRDENMKNAVLICDFLISQGKNVVISMVFPNKDIRDDLKLHNKCIEVYLTSEDKRGKEEFNCEYYEKPTENFIELDTTEITEDQVYQLFRNKMKGK